MPIAVALYFVFHGILASVIKNTVVSSASYVGLCAIRARLSKSHSDIPASRFGDTVRFDATALSRPGLAPTLPKHLLPADPAATGLLGSSRCHYSFCSRQRRRVWSLFSACFTFPCITRQYSFCFDTLSVVDIGQRMFCGRALKATAIAEPFIQ